MTTLNDSQGYLRHNGYQKWINTNPAKKQVLKIVEMPFYGMSL